MAANVFGMDAENTRTGLGAAGLAAQAGVAAGLAPALPKGAYTAVYTGAAETLLAKLEAEASALVEFGLVTSAASVTTVESAENQNARELGT
ncbi:hypothetical protein [Mycolicibacterium boenickei]|uniref:PE family protein n=1 Tax=Mycolicibacterium boenickei TaxID=146017 RepID=A0ABN5ZNF2_9MYCO|nr:hypothetical protein [Mycolicibacterium boenickei]PEG56752.1 hypothetical protein CQY21_31000 [Mycolicibacterium boenickei]BBX94702.1 hypothetical protein MBOE_63510 [Mycolicibacterium boenickei]